MKKLPGDLFKVIFGYGYNCATKHYVKKAI